MFRKWWPTTKTPKAKRILVRPLLVSLEDRSTPAVTANFAAGVLTVSMDDNSDAAFLRVNGTGKIEVATDALFASPVGASPFGGVNSILVQDTGAKSLQSVSFVGANTFNLSSNLKIDGIETAIATQNLNVNGGLIVDNGISFVSNGISTGSKDIVIAADTIDFLGGANSVSTTGAVVLRPLTQTLDFELNGALDTVGKFTLTATDITAINPTSKLIYLGSVGSAGKMTVEAPLTVLANLSLANSGVGGSIDISNSINVGTFNLDFTTNTTLIQSAGIITAGQLSFNIPAVASFLNANKVSKITGSAGTLDYNGESVSLNNILVTNTANVTSTGTISIIGNVTAGDDITLTTTDAAGAGQNIAVNSGTVVRSTGGDVFINAGDNLTVAGTVKADVGNVLMAIDAGNADAGTGASGSISQGIFVGAAISLIGGSDADTFTTGSGSSNVAIDGKAPSAIPGDTLVVDFGAANVIATYDGVNVLLNGAVFSATDIETSTFQTTGKLIVQGTGIDDTFSLQKTAGVTTFSIGASGPVAFTAGSLEFAGLGGDDTLTVDYTNGNPLTAAGISYDGAGVGTLVVKGSGGQKAIYTPSAATTGTGSVVVDGQPITFVGLSPVDISDMASVTLSLPAGGNDIATKGGFDFATGAIPSLVTTGKTAGKAVDIEALAVWNVGTFTIETLIAGDDSITVNDSTNAHNITNFVVNAGSGSDVVTVADNTTFIGDVTLSSGKTITATAGKTVTANNVVFNADNAGATGGIINAVDADFITTSTTFNGGGANDVFNITGYTSAVSIDGLAGTDGVFVNGKAGNLNLDGSTITSAGKAAVTTSNIESLDVSNANTVTASNTVSYSDLININSTKLVLNDGASVAGGDVSFTTTAGVDTGASTITGKSFVVQGAGAMVVRATTFTTVNTTADTKFNTTVEGPGGMKVATTGNTFINKTIGAISPVLFFTSNGGGTTTLSSGLISTNSDVTIGDALVVNTLNATIQSVNGPIAFNNTVTLSKDLITKTTVAGGVEFNGNIVGPSALTSNTVDGTSFNGIVGSGTRLASVTVTGPTTVAGGSVLTTGTQNYAGLVSISSNTLFDSGNTSQVFSAGINSTADGTNTATIIAGTGTVTFAGDAGTTKRLSNLSVSSKSVALNGIVRAKTEAAFTVTNGMTQAAGGTGIVASQISLNGGGDFNLGLADTKTDAGLVGLRANLTAAGTITFRDVDCILVDSAGGGIRTQNGNVTLLTANDLVVRDHRIGATRYSTPVVNIGTGNLRLYPGQTKAAGVIFDAEVIANTVVIGDAGVTFPNVFADVFSIRPSANVDITVNGNQPVGSPGDSLSIIKEDVTGLSLIINNATDGKYSFSNRKSVTYTGIDQIGGLALDAFAVQIKTANPLNNAETINSAEFRIIQTVQGGSTNIQLSITGQPGNPFVVAPQYTGTYGPYAPPTITFAYIDNDFVQDIILANGSDTAPIITILNGAAILNSGITTIDIKNVPPALLLAQKTVFEESFYGGISVTATDIDGDNRAELIVGAGPSGGPRVRVLRYDSADIANNKLASVADFFAYEASFRGGVNVAGGDVNGDGFGDIVVGSGVGGGPRVRVLNGQTINAQGLGYNGLGGTIADFFAYEASFRGGVLVAVGNHNGDQFMDVATGPGQGGGPRVRILDGSNLNNVFADFFAFVDSPSVIGGDNPYYGGVGGLAFGRESKVGGNQQQILVASNRGRAVSVTAFDHDATFKVIAGAPNDLVKAGGIFLPGGKLEIVPDVTKLRDAVSVGGFFTDVVGTINGGALCQDDANDF